MARSNLWGKNALNPATRAAPAYTVGGLARSCAHGGRLYRVLAVAPYVGPMPAWYCTAYLTNTPPTGPMALTLQYLGCLGNTGPWCGPAKRKTIRTVHWGQKATPGWYTPCQPGPALPAWAQA